jgi:hypothetical protein
MVEFITSYVGSHWISRFLLFRVLGLTYAFAFLSAALQIKPLIGESGLTPAKQFLNRLSQRFSSIGEALWYHPTLFWFNDSDAALTSVAWIGFFLSLLVTFGLANIPILLALWALYLSIVKVGQVWYGYGWESQLLETGFLAVFLAPPLNPMPFASFQPPTVAILLTWWLVIRIYLGAGLIKLRGDTCWTDLTALEYHFETQPIPNPLSTFFHHLPNTVLKAGTVLTHIVQVGVPWLILAPLEVRSVAGILLIGFQLALMVSGNISFLNLVTIVPTIPVLTDQAWSYVMPSVVRRQASVAAANAWTFPYHAWVYALVVVYLSVPVVKNLLSHHQAMNASFNQFSLVNTYGAFGSVTKQRNELVIQGTSDDKIDENTEWKTYEFPGKPTDPERSLSFIAPYQPRIDWQLWFAAFQSPRQNPWLFTFIDKLLENDEHATSLLRDNPLEDESPEYIRVEYYQYHLNPPFSDQPWSREYKGTYIQPRSKDGFRTSRFKRSS